MVERKRLTPGAVRSKDPVLGSLAAGRQDCGKICRAETAEAETEPREMPRMSQSLLCGREKWVC